MTSAVFTLVSASLSDVPALSKISADAFVSDRNTELKGLGKIPYSMEDIAMVDIPRYLASSKCVVLKAVHHETGRIVGWGCWGFCGFKPEEIPVNGSVESIAAVGHSGEETSNQNQSSVEKQVSEGDVTKTSTTQAISSDIDAIVSDSAPQNDDDPIKRLEELTDADMRRWESQLMPLGTRCMFVVSLSVAPAWQSHGVGKALLRWGTANADREGVFCWVHSSEAAWGVYAKAGFKVVGTLEVELDDYAPAGSSGPRGGWGKYVFRYMKRDPVVDPETGR